MQRFGSVAGRGLGPDQLQVCVLAVGLECHRLGRGGGRGLRVTKHERGLGDAVERATQHHHEVGPLRLHPDPFLAGKECAPGERGRDQRRVARLRRVVLRQRGLRSLDGLLGRLHVDPHVGWEVQLVTAERVRQQSVAEVRRGQHRAQLGDHDRQALLPGPGWLSGPEQIGELVAGNGPPVLDEQVGQGQSALVAGQVDFVDRDVARLDAHPLGQMGAHSHMSLPARQPDDNCTITAG